MKSISRRSRGSIWKLRCSALLPLVIFSAFVTCVTLYNLPNSTVEARTNSVVNNAMHPWWQQDWRGLVPRMGEARRRGETVGFRDAPAAMFYVARLIWCVRSSRFSGKQAGFSSCLPPCFAAGLPLAVVSGRRVSWTFVFMPAFTHIFLVPGTRMVLGSGGGRGDRFQDGLPRTRGRCPGAAGDDFSSRRRTVADRGGGQ